MIVYYGASTDDGRFSNLASFTIYDMIIGLYGAGYRQTSDWDFG